jgi:hypothetical protein
MRRMRSSLGRHQATTPADDEQLQRMRTAAYHRQGIAVLTIGDIENEWLRLAIENECQRRYGRREG